MVTLAAPSALAQPAEDPARTKARVLAYAGVEAYAVGDFRTAHEKLDEAYGLLHVPSLGLWSARALVKVGKLVQAEERYRAVASLVLEPGDPPVQVQAKADAAREHQELLPRVPSVSFKLVGATSEQVSVEVDGVALARDELVRTRLLDPGRHVVVGKRGSDKPVVVLDLQEGQHRDVSLDFSHGQEVGSRVPLASDGHGARAAAEASPNVLRTAGWITLGVAGASIATGAVAYLVGRDKYERLEQSSTCAQPECTGPSVGAYNAYASWRTVHVTGLITGGILGAAGVVLFVAGTPGSASVTSHASLTLRVGPASASLAGRF